MGLFRKKHERPNVVIQKHTPLTEAVLRSDYSARRELAAAGANPNEIDDYRMTPLQWAIMRGDIALEC